jgi:predicted DNA-binding transcriptional regulator YafY
MTDSHFERPEDFDLAAFWADWCTRFETTRDQYEVTLRVPPKGVLLMAQVFGEGIHNLVEQAGSPDPDGCLTFSLTFESPGEACQKLLGLGTMVEVLEPQAMRDQMLNTARQLTTFYADT